jgi:DNA-binding Lrp family transcriptional regulator
VPQVTTLDDLDAAIVGRLAADGRISNSDLAAAVGVAPSTCLVRVRQLRASGAIRGFHADVDPAAIGRPLQALVAVRLRAEARTRIAEYGARLAALPGVLTVYFLAGANDFQLHVAARSTDDLRDFVVEHLSASADVAMTETSLIFEHIRSPLTPAE